MIVLERYKLPKESQSGCPEVDVYLEGSGDPDDIHDIVGIMICGKLGIGKVGNFDKLEHHFL